MNARILFLAVVALALVIVPVSSQAQSWCGIQTLYFQHNASTSPAGYEELINYPSGNAQEDENITITSAMGPVLVDAYISPENSLHNAQELLKGLRRYRMFHYVNSASGVTQANYSVFIRSINGTETYVYSAISDDINALDSTEYLTSYVKQTDSFFQPTDRIVIKVYGQTSHPAPIVFHFVYQGSTNTSHVESGYFVCESTAMLQSAAFYPQPTPINPLVIIAGIAAAVVLYRKKE